MAKTKRAKYDDDALVLAIAKAEQSYAQIAAAAGLSEKHVSQIARGLRRPELQARIEAARQSYLDAARRLTVRAAQAAVAKLVALISKDSPAPPEVQRKAAADILRLALGDSSNPQPISINQYQNQALDLLALSPETKRRILKELGGPAEQ